MAVHNDVLYMCMYACWCIQLLRPKWRSENTGKIAKESEDSLYIKCCGCGDLDTDNILDIHVRQAHILDSLPFLSLCFRASSGFSYGWEKFGCFYFNHHERLMSNLLTYPSKNFSLILSLSHSLWRHKMEGCFILNFPFPLLFPTWRTMSWDVRNILQKAGGYFVTEWGIFVCVALQLRFDLMMWHFPLTNLENFLPRGFSQSSLKSMGVFPLASTLSHWLWWTLDQAHNEYLDTVCSNVSALSHLLKGLKELIFPSFSNIFK